MPDDQPTEVRYRLPCTTLTVSGRRETGALWATGEEFVRTSADVEVGVEADRRGPLLPLPDLERSHDFEVALLADGRLARIESATRSLVGDAVDATVSLASFAAGLLGAAIAPRLGPVPVPPGGRQIFKSAVEGRPSPAGEWAEAGGPDGDAARLAAAVEALRELADAGIRVARAMAGTETPAHEYRKLRGIRAATAAVREEIAAITARRDAWYRARHVNAAEHEFQLPVDAAFHVPSSGGVPAQTIKASDLTGGAAAAHAAHRTLHVAVAEVRGAADAVAAERRFDAGELLRALEDGPRAPAIWARIPRSAVVALYVEADGPDFGDPDRELELHSVHRLWAVDRESHHAPLRLADDGGLEMSAAFGPSGALASVTVDEQKVIESVL